MKLRSKKRLKTILWVVLIYAMILSSSVFLYCIVFLIIYLFNKSILTYEMHYISNNSSTKKVINKIKK